MQAGWSPTLARWVAEEETLTPTDNKHSARRSSPLCKSPQVEITNLTLDSTLLFKQTESYPNLIALSDKVQVKIVATVEVGL